MAKLLILLVICMFYGLANSRPVSETVFLVQGRVYCDTCQAGFETSATTYIKGAKVKVECRDRQSLALRYTVDGVTDTTGTYKLHIHGDHENDICETILVSSPQNGCTTIEIGRERSRLSLTNKSGISSNVRYSNNLGFVRDVPLAGCTELMKQYQETGDGI